MSFKISDWISTKGRTNHPSYITKIIRINNARNPYTRDYSGPVVINGTADTTLQNIEPQQPKEGEWCWFYDQNGSYKTLGLAKFQKIIDGKYEGIEIDCYRLTKFCKSFIGQLPNILK